MTRKSEVKVYRVFGGWCVVDDDGAYLEGYFNILQWN